MRANRQDETDHTAVYVKPKPHKMLKADQPIPMPQENQLKYLEIPEPDLGSSLSDHFSKIRKTNEEQVLQEQVLKVSSVNKCGLSIQIPKKKQDKLRREKVINPPDQNNNLQNSTSHRENSSIKSRLIRY